MEKQANNKVGLATDFEFKFRFWIILAIYGLAFACYGFDRKDVAFGLAQYIEKHFPTDLPVANIILALSAIPAILSAYITTWAAGYLGAEGVDSMQMATSRLVAEGPYRFVRHPVYLGTILFSWSFGSLLSLSGLTIALVGIAVFTWRLILREESELMVAQGERYRTYCASVPRLLPRLRPQLGPGEGKLNWRDTLWGGIYSWTLAAALLVFALTLRIVFFYWILAGAVLIKSISTLVANRPRKYAAV